MLFTLLVINLVAALLFIGCGLLTHKYPQLLSDYRKEALPSPATLKRIQQAFVYTGVLTALGNIAFYLLGSEIGMLSFLFFPLMLTTLYLLFTTEDLSRFKGRLALAVTLLILVGVPAWLAYGMTRPSVQLLDDRLRITGMYGTEIPYSELTDVEQLDTLPPVTLRTNGLAFNGINKGWFKVKGCPKALLFIHSARSPYLHLTTQEGTHIFLNQPDGTTVPALHATLQSTTRVPASEYLIEGRLTHVPDSVVIKLYRQDGQLLKPVRNDTLVDGRFAFGDTITSTCKYLLMCNAPGFPGTWLNVWVAPGQYVGVTGNDRLLLTWDVASDVPEQAVYNSLRACVREEQRERMQLKAIESDWMTRMRKEHAGDQAFTKLAWQKIDSLRVLGDSLQLIISKKEIDHMSTLPVSNVWMENLVSYARLIPYKDLMPYTDELKALYNRLTPEQRNTPEAQTVYEMLNLPAPVNVGDAMADGDLYDSEGRLHHLSEFKGRYILLDFWSNGCGPCVRSIPEMETVIDTYGDRLAVVGISEDPKGHWVKYLKEKQLKGYQWNELRQGRTGLAASYRVRGIPHYVLIAPDGTVKATWTGYGKGSLLKHLKKHLDE